MDPKQANTGVAPVNDPAQAGGAVTENTLENLTSNIAEQLASVADANAGDATNVASTEASGDPPAAAETKVEKTEAEVVEEAKQQRIHQDNKNLRATLRKVGIDPDSDTAEQLRSGLITFDDVMRTRTPVQPTVAQPTEPATPQVSLDQKIINLRNRLSRKGAVTDDLYKEDMGAALEVIADVVQANQNITQTMENNDLNNLLATTLNATKETFVSDVKSELPEDVRAIGEELFVGATDVAVGSLARQVGKAKAFTPDGYRHAGKGVAPKFDKFVQSIFKAGQNAAVNAIKAANPNLKGPVVNPIAPGTGGGSPAPPADPNKFTEKNLNANVAEFLATTQKQV
jgi:hypothetical protein